VLDGRDIGTIVCPNAAVKLFVTAGVETRARRRLEQLRQDGLPAIYDAVLQDLTQRDARDTGRRDAPLKAAPDAICIDTTGLDADAVFARARTLVERAYRGPR
jgi:cytidylate kinase